MSKNWISRIGNTFAAVADKASTVLNTGFLDGVISQDNQDAIRSIASTVTSLNRAFGGQAPTTSLTSGNALTVMKEITSSLAEAQDGAQKTLAPVTDLVLLSDEKEDTSAAINDVASRYNNSAALNLVQQAQEAETVVQSLIDTGALGLDKTIENVSNGLSTEEMNYDAVKASQDLAVLNYYNLGLLGEITLNGNVSITSQVTWTMTSLAVNSTTYSGTDATDNGLEVVSTSGTNSTIVFEGVTVNQMGQEYVPEIEAEAWTIMHGFQEDYDWKFACYEWNVEYEVRITVLDTSGGGDLFALLGSSLMIQMWYLQEGGDQEEWESSSFKIALEDTGDDSIQITTNIVPSIYNTDGKVVFDAALFAINASNDVEVRFAFLTNNFRGYPVVDECPVENVTYWDGEKVSSLQRSDRWIDVFGKVVNRAGDDPNYGVVPLWKQLVGDKQQLFYKLASALKAYSDKAFGESNTDISIDDKYKEYGCTILDMAKMSQFIYKDSKMSVLSVNDRGKILDTFLHDLLAMDGGIELNAKMSEFFGTSMAVTCRY